MNYRKIGVAFTICMVLSLVSAGSAQANWEIEGKSFSSGQMEDVSIQSSEGYDLDTTVVGLHLTITATGVHCTGTCTIDESGNVELVDGKLEFTGMTVDTPAGCTIPSTMTTRTLSAELIMDPGGGTATFLRWKPATGETIAEFELGGTCALAGTPLRIKGTITSRLNNTGVSAVEQPATFSFAEQTTGGGSLKAGKEVATLTGKLGIKLSGANAAKKWSGS